MASRRLLQCAGLLVFLLVSACSAPQSTAIVNAPGDLPQQAMITAVPFFPQEAYYWGPAALAMSPAWSGLAETPGTVAGQVYTPGQQGTLAADFCFRRAPQGKAGGRNTRP